MVDSFFKIGNGWDAELADEFGAEYCKKLSQSITDEYSKYKVYPPRESVFAALKAVDYSDVKVCILGQDPYHGAGQANGMAFAVCDGIPFPPSLSNIFKELKDDIKIDSPKAGTLTGWAKQGVLLLNATLTVRESLPLSHAGFGWNRFTDAIIHKLSGRQQPLVFILWGASAIAKAKIIAPHHCILASPHPSPLSASRGFFGSKPFSRANEFLSRGGFSTIDWAVINEDSSRNEPAKSKVSPVKPPEASVAASKQESIRRNISAPHRPVTAENGKASYYNGTGSITKI